MERNFAMFFTIVSFYVEISFDEVILLRAYRLANSTQRNFERMASNLVPDPGSIKCGILRFSIANSG
jgi:hypothetical protein